MPKAAADGFHDGGWEADVNWVMAQVDSAR